MDPLQAVIQTIIPSTLGAVFVGFAVSCVVYGILMTQVFYYFRGYPLDKPMYKISVMAILLLETADQAFIGHLVYYYSISNFGQWAVLLKASMTWSLILQLTVGAVVGLIVKTYFGLRVWRFSGRNIYITGFILFLAFAQMGLAVAYATKAFMLPSIFAARQLQILGSVSLGTGVLTDVVTAATLCFFLNRLRTGHKTSDSLVNMLCSYAINTGILTSAVSITTLVLYDIMPDNLYFVATYFTLSKLYAISFMATLNTRRQVRGRGTEQQGDTTNHTNMFHLGTRVPSMGPSDLDQWDKVMPSRARGGSVLMEVPQIYAKDEFPYNSFHPGVGSQKNSVGRAF
ncbi:hypothetical protein P691DRAFT_806472 [Macrolepiota fuliginosa MF-IS2]|uniref:DUF6534 domain-containing protein n=1 Tax=Macrolepiota fuliginosa MF-IS2 TaxID=1400762 RepID=A0A9P5XLM7_9AGAR|nr:hypothetical protein P691DRAFT_806472 [Macrolepiota fuliginosa MF-IS2]